MFTLHPGRIATTIACAVSTLAVLTASPAAAAPYPPPVPVSLTTAVGTAPPTADMGLAPSTAAPVGTTPPAVPASGTAAPFAPVRAHASGLPWSDGGYFSHDSTQAETFAAWRGRPIDNIVAFTHRQNWPAQLDPWWASSLPTTFDPGRDDVILSVPLWTDDSDPGTDAQWTQLATATAGVDRDAYVRLGWEMNCCFSLATDPDTWRTQFTRAATLLTAAAPELRIVFNPNEGASSNNTVTDPSLLYVNGLIDVVAIDAYDWYPAYTDQTNWAQHRDKPLGWNHWYDFAQAKGVPFGIAEFGVSAASPDSGGDNPAYFDAVYGWLAEKATTTPGSIAFVSIFNEPAAYCRCQLFPTTANPRAGARYQQLLTALADAGPAPASPRPAAAAPETTVPGVAG